MRIRLAIIMLGAVCSLGATPKAPLSESSFSTTGTNNQKLLQNIYAGRFEDVTIERDDVYFGFLYGKFLSEYGTRCKSSLPANRVPIMKTVCDERVITRNGWGIEVGSRCLHTMEVPTGVYADPEMYAAKLVVEKNIDANALRQTMRLLGGAGKDPFAPAMNMLSTTADLEQDANLLVRLNACSGPAMMRFQENLKRYALGKQSILLNASSKAPVAQTALPRDANYRALIEDLISDYATTWAMNRYISGSVDGVEVAADTVTARYRYDGFNPGSDGSVRITFADGLPECMYFFDAPSSCKTPNRKIVAAWRDGKYRSETVPPASAPAATVEVTPPPEPEREVPKPEAAEASVHDTDFGDIGSYDELRVRKRVRLDIEPPDAMVSIRGVGEPFKNRGKAEKYAGPQSFAVDREPQLLLIRRAGYRDRLIVLTLDEEDGDETIRVWLFEDR